MVAVAPSRVNGALIVSVRPVPLKLVADKPSVMAPPELKSSELPKFAPALPIVKAPAAPSKTILPMLRPESIVTEVPPVAELKVATSVLDVPVTPPGALAGDQLPDVAHACVPVPPAHVALAPEAEEFMNRPRAIKGIPRTRCFIIIRRGIEFTDQSQSTHPFYNAFVKKGRLFSSF